MNYEIPFVSFLVRPFWLGLGGSSKSSTAQNTDNSTKVETTNQQVGASEGAFAAGAGSNVSIQSADAAVVKNAADALVAISGDNTKNVATTVDANKDVSKTAVETTADVAKSSVRDSLAFGESALDNVRRTTDSANELLSRSFESYAGKLSDNKGVAPQTVFADSQKNMIYAGVLLVVGLLGFSLLNKGGK